MDFTELLSKPSSEFKKYDLDGQQLFARVLKVHDTDTITIGWNQKGDYVKTNVRLNSIDAPELHSRKNGGKEAKLCMLGRDWLSGKILDKLVIVVCDEYDKYGRLLADVYEFTEDFDQQKSVSLNQQLVDHKFARVYGGNLHKDDWTNDELNSGLGIAMGMGLG